MAISIPTLRTYLNEFDFRNLFVEGLNWQHYRQRVPSYTVQDGNSYRFTSVAEQGGMVVLECQSSDGALPPKNVRDKIEKHITALAHEHILIFVNESRSTSLWQWVKRGQGAAKTRTHTVHKGQLADALLQKLAGIAFTLEELDEDGRALISTVTEKVSKAFDREKVTKKFYDEFKRKHDNFREFLTGIQARADRDWYTSVMLNRLMFLYFVQSKGFLNGDRNYLRHKLEQTKGNYYRDFLTTLFFKGLAQEEGERTNEVNQLLGKVPYLNGGLFLKHQLEETYKEKIQIDNCAFEQLFDFFDEWNWHLDDRELREQNEINPDVLGYIFEKYINQKQMGAYYTQEDITNYICKNTILPFLLEKTGVKVQDLLPEIDPYIYPAVKQADYLPTETEREYNARQDRYQQILADYQAGKIATINNLITYNLDIETIVKDWLMRLNNHVTLNTFYFDGLKKLTVLDPTCGSGAFLFAAMNILEPLYDIALERMTHFTHPVNHRHFIDELAQVRKHANLTYFVLKSIIIHNLYGVDIMDEAVEICKLRLFLKLVAQIEAFDDIEPLPDIDFNIRAGNTLVGFATEREISGGLIYEDVKNRVLGLNIKLRNFRKSQVDFRIKSKELQETKKELQNDFSNLRVELDKSLMQRDRKTANLSHKPFHWILEFNDTIVDREGFDVIVGNPPYVEYRKIKAQYTLANYDTLSCGNLYAYVVERNFSLSHRYTWSGMIIPHSAFCTDRMGPLMKLFKKEKTLWLSYYDIRPAQLFSGVDQRLSIYITKMTSATKTYSTNYQRWNEEFRPLLFSNINYVDIDNTKFVNAFPKLSTKLESQIIQKTGGISRLGLFLKGKHLIYYHNAPRYWIRAMNFVPYFWNERDGEIQSSHVKTIALSDQETRDVVLSILNSSFFYWWFIILSNCRDLVIREIESVPVGINKMSTSLKHNLILLGQKLMEDLKKNAIRKRPYYKTTGQVEYDEFYPRLSKPIIDEIDRVLAQHYGFTDEELDFIINYDIKYRMGKEGESEE